MKHFSSTAIIGMYSFRIVALATALLASMFCAAGAIDVFDFDNELERGRYLKLVAELRCPKCQNQNLADSNSQIAIDLRAEVARMVQEGLDDPDVKEYMVNRYGDFVLYNPPVQNNTLVLWWAPVLMGLIGLLVFGAIIYQRRKLQLSGEPEVDKPHEKNAAQSGTNQASE
ncbi:cytochrome c-type biogenesis protein CcmH [Alteromonadaceae bacterium Bs31]|nr:cytochrome c-type biogenesis protein CcmH [Alteromonadaceae bacterium Bs31]